MIYKKIRELREKYDVSWELLQQDYLLSWMLAGLAATPELKKILIFKGGTALKKSYFGEYRFSQDLDFTVIDSIPSNAALEELLSTACTKAMALQSSQNEPVAIAWQEYTEKKPHPHNQKAFVITGQFSWHSEPLTRIMVEITTQEKLLLQPVERPIIHEDYDEQLEASFKTYRLEEIIAEKVRAILQFAAKLHERGWGRSRARDYYDLWRILKEYRDHIDMTLLPDMVVQKCAHKDVIFSGPDDLFSAMLMQNLDEAWLRWLAPFVPGLPQQTVVIRELKAELDNVWQK